jgi:hypothetical protein
MTKEWCLQLLGNHKEAFDIEQKVFNDYYNNYSQNKTTFKALLTSAFMNYISVCASAKNKDAYIRALNQFHDCFNNDFEVNPLLHLVYLTFNIQKATYFNEVSNLTYDLLQLETVYNNIPKGSIDIAIAKSCESALYHCHNILGNYDKAKHYCENVMKLKLTTGFRKDYIEIANLYYMVILFEEALQKQSSKTILKFVDQLLKIHANQYYERIRKSTDNYSFDLLLINFFRKLPEKIKKHDLAVLIEKIYAKTQALKLKPENLYIYNMMILLDFEKWLTDKIEQFS